MKALVIVDMQNDFMPWGSLAVPNGDEIIPVICELISKFPVVLATQDWHPSDHVSFAAIHKGKSPGDKIEINGVEQILWPTHCVQGSHGAELVQDLKEQAIAEVFYKGTDRGVDSYSAFYDNAHLKSTGLASSLQSKHVEEVYLAGVATDYCVLYSALDALALGFKVRVIRDACRPINLDPEDEEKAVKLMQGKGVQVVQSTKVLEWKSSFSRLN